MKHLSTLLLVWGLCLSSAFGQYCLPTYTTGPTVGDSIVSFSLGTIVGTFPGSPSGYNDYTALASTILVPGLTYTATIVNNPTFTSGVGIWIDYDQNQVFDATELVGSTNPVIPAGGTATITFTVPVTALSGVTRLRMVHNFAGNPTDPCGTFTWGETEDYGITIPAGLADDVTPTSFVIGNLDCNVFTTGIPVTVNLANIGSNVADTVLVTYSINGSTPVTDTAFNLAAPSLNTFTFPGTFPISPSSLYTATVYTTYPADQNTSNDTLIATFLSPPAFSMPYTEDFEAFTPGAPGTLSNGWTRSNSAGHAWFPNTGQTGSTGTGPNDDHTPNGSVYMYTETSPGAIGSVTSLFSPCIDLGGSTGPRLSFWYHMFGADMGTLEVHILSGGLDTTVWSLSGPQQSGLADPWREANVDLTFFAGQVVTIEFRGIKGNGFTSDMAIDDISIFNPAPLDVGATAVIDPEGPGCYSAAKDVLVEFRNFGSDTLDMSANNVTVNVEITGPVPTQNFSVVVSSGILPVLEYDTALVTTSADFSAVGVYTITAYTSLTGDTIVFNDTIVGSAESLPVVTSVSEDFETFLTGIPGVLANGWTRSPGNLTNEGWIVDNFGTPTFNTGPSDDHTANGSIYMFIESSSGAVGNQYSLFTPCLDFSGLTAPRLGFWYHMAGANMGTLEVWAVGTVDTLLWTVSGPQQLNSADPWLEAIVDLSPLAGEDVQIEFRGTLGGPFIGSSDMAIDDVEIFDPAPLDAASIDIEPFGAGCYTSSEDITVILRNEGNQVLDFSVNNATVTIDITGASTQNFSTTVTSGTVPVLGTFPVTVTTTADLSATGFHNFMAYVDLTGDTIPSNDTTLGFVETLPTFSAPYTEDFETFTTGFPGTLNNGWTFGNTTGYRWQVDNFGTGSGGTGPADDHTLLGSIYLYTEASSGFTGDSTSVFTPCIDLAGLMAPRLSFWYHMFGGNMGDLEVYALAGGVSTLVWSISGQQQSSDTSPWLEAIADLTPFVGQAIQLEFRGIRGTGFQSDMAIDDIQIIEPAPIDAAANAIDPSGDGCYTTSETVTVTIRNEGSQVLDFSVTNATVTLDVTGASTQNFSTTVTSGTVPVLGTFPVVVTTTADFTTPGFHNFLATVTVTGDTVNSNDSTVGFVGALPIIATPYFEDFETFSTGFPGTLNNGWTFGNTTGYRWQVDNFGTGSFGTGPADDHTANGSIYMYTEASTGGLGDSTSLFTPCIDLGGLTAPRLSFWYHMFGAQMGELEVYAIAGGVSTLLFSQSGQQQTSEFDPWIEAFGDLAPYAGQVVQLEFRGFRGAGLTGDLAIDDINIFDPPPLDVGVAGTLPDAQTCYPGATDGSVIIRNLGNQALDLSVNPVTVTLDVAGPTPQSFTATANSGILPVFGTQTVLVTTNLNLNTGGLYTFTGIATTTGDTIQTNDTLSTDVNVIAVVNGGVIEDFETFIPSAGFGIPQVLQNSWTTEGLNGGWTVQTGPTGSGGTGPASGNPATNSQIYMYTETSGGFVGDTFRLVSPCVDLTNQTTPVLSYAYHMFGATMGTLEVHVLQNGLDTTIWSLSGQQQTADTDPWIDTMLDLSFFAGDLLQVEFRGRRGTGFTSDMAVDDIGLYEFLPQDASLPAIFSPTSDCALGDSLDVVVALENFGSDTIFSADISLQIDNGSVVTVTVTDTILPGGFIPVFIPGQDFSTPGDYTITLWPTLTGDTNGFNDTVTTVVTSIPIITSYPYFEDFESGNGGWIADQGNNGTWEFGTPAKNTIQGAASGVNAWVTGGLGTGFYNNNDNSEVIGPCFDFSSLLNPAIILDVWWNSEFSWMVQYCNLPSMVELAGRM